MIIYKIENKINGKIYIGQTKYTIEKRIYSHLRANSFIGKALRKYDIQSFDISIIDNATIKEVLNEKEVYWIKFYNCKSPNGYNLTDGGEGTSGHIHIVSQETRKKISKANTGENNAAKRPEVRAKMSESARKNGNRIGKHPGNWQGEDKIINCAYCGKELKVRPNSKRKYCNNICSSKDRKPTSEETKKKLRKAQTGKKASEETKQKMRKPKKKFKII
jgi:group I intron endonuclease